MRVLQVVPSSNDWPKVSAQVRAGDSNAALQILNGQLILTSDEFGEAIIREQLAAVYQMTGQPVQAEAELTAAILTLGQKYVPVQARFHLTLGLLYQKAEDLEKALEEYGRGIEKLIDF